MRDRNTRGIAAASLGFATADRRLFAVCDDMIMAVVDADSGRVIATPQIGYGPYVSGFDLDTHLVFSSDGAGRLTVIHEDSPRSVYRAGQRSGVGGRTRYFIGASRTAPATLIVPVPDALPNGSVLMMYQVQ